MRAMTGLSQKKFNGLLPTFSQVYHQVQQKKYEIGLSLGLRKRKPGGGRKGKLPGMKDKLFFILNYYKTYPTFDELGARFDLARSKAHRQVHQLSEVLNRTLITLELLPARKFESIEAFKQSVGQLDHLLIDGTERSHQRPQDAQTQKDLYSGKKTTYGSELDHLDFG